MRPQIQRLQPGRREVRIGLEVAVLPERIHWRFKGEIQRGDSKGRFKGEIQRDRHFPIDDARRQGWALLYLADGVGWIFNGLVFM